MKISPDIKKQFDQWAREAAKSEKGVAVLPLKKKIIDHLNSLFPRDDFVEINGQTYKIREYTKTVTDYAKIVQRTERRKAQTRSVLAQCREFDEDLVEVSIHDNPCEICAQYAGKVYSISGKHPKYPAVTVLPPFHPGCRHSINPTSDNALSWREKWNQGDKP
jgi:hypothetical protein